MKTLFIDTHYLDIIIALLEDGKVVNKKEVKNKKNNSEYIFPTIIDVLNDTKIDEIIVVNGPGSFTGVRLGVTIAKTLAYTLKIGLRTIDSLKVVSISTNSKKVALSDENGYYVGLFNDENEPIKEYTYLNNDEYDDLSDKNDYINEYILDIEKVNNYLKNKEYINAHEAKPIYIKKIGVELDKKS